MKILFLCVANSARSQMAEGLARHEFGGSADVLSAGSHPKNIHPLAIQSLNEIGIDISHHKAKSIDSIDVESVDLIITLCADEICPLIIGGQKRQHWSYPDPADPKLSTHEQEIQFAKIRDQLLERIRKLKDAKNI